MGMLADSYLREAFGTDPTLGETYAVWGAADAFREVHEEAKRAPAGIPGEAAPHWKPAEPLQARPHLTPGRPVRSKAPLAEERAPQEVQTTPSTGVGKSNPVATILEAKPGVPPRGAPEGPPGIPPRDPAKQPTGRGTCWKRETPCWAARRSTTARPPMSRCVCGPPLARRTLQDRRAHPKGLGRPVGELQGQAVPGQHAPPAGSGQLAG